jgi:hypothetical protein
MRVRSFLAAVASNSASTAASRPAANNSTRWALSGRNLECS